MSRSLEERKQVLLKSCRDFYTAPSIGFSCSLRKAAQLRKSAIRKKSDSEDLLIRFYLVSQRDLVQQTILSEPWPKDISSFTSLKSIPEISRERFTASTTLENRVSPTDTEISHTRAIFLMDKYGVTDNFSQFFIVLFMSFITFFIIICMIQHGSYEEDDPRRAEARMWWAKNQTVTGTSWHEYQEEFSYKKNRRRLVSISCLCKKREIVM